MASNSNQFLLSVADVIVRDREADQIMLYGKTEIESSIAQDVASTEIMGGQGNQLLYDFQHSKKLNITINDAKFDEGYIAIQSGVLITNQAKNIFKREFITLDGTGKGVITTTPIGNVYLQNANGNIVTVTPSTLNVTYAGWANQQVEAVYKYSNNVDTIDLNASIFTKSYELTLIGNIFDKTGKSAEVQIIIPQFKPDGKFTLNFKADGYTTTPLNGKALVDQVTKSYGCLNIVPTSSSISYIAVAATPSTVSLSSSSSTQQINVYGVRGGQYAPVVFSPSDCTYVSSTPATATVSASGLITRVATGTTTITVTHTASSLKDYVQVTCS